MSGTTHRTLGLLGTDPRAAEVVEAARADGWEVVAVADAATDADAAVGQLPWTLLLDAEFCAAVIVGADGWCPARAEAVRALVQAGRTLVLSQPLEPSMLWAFELDMIARDSGARLVPILPDRLHPCVAALKAAIEEAAAAGSAPLGGLESLRLERTMTDRSQTAVLAALSRDVDIVRAVAGDPARVTTLGAGDPDAAWANLAVGLSGPDRLPARWQVAAGSPAGLRITLCRASGTTEVFAPDGPEPWTATAPVPAPGPFHRGATILHLLTAALDGGPPALPAAVPPATWPDAARALEIAETVPRSLAKGRAIDLHHEEFSELGTFKGTMASLGCGIVIFSLLVVVLATLVAGVSQAVDWKPGLAITRAWPAVVLGAMLAFLALQLLPLLLGPRRPAGGPPPSPPAD